VFTTIQYGNNVDDEQPCEAEEVRWGILSAAKHPKKYGLVIRLRESTFVICNPSIMDEFFLMIKNN
jgi:hypothetical protein